MASGGPSTLSQAMQAELRQPTHHEPTSGVEHHRGQQEQQPSSSGRGVPCSPATASAQHSPSLNAAPVQGPPNAQGAVFTNPCSRPVYFVPFTYPAPSQHAGGQLWTACTPAGAAMYTTYPQPSTLHTHVLTAQMATATPGIAQVMLPYCTHTAGIPTIPLVPTCVPQSASWVLGAAAHNPGAPFARSMLDIYPTPPLARSSTSVVQGAEEPNLQPASETPAGAGPNLQTTEQLREPVKERAHDTAHDTRQQLLPGPAEGIDCTLSGDEHVAAAGAGTGMVGSTEMLDGDCVMASQDPSPGGDCMGQHQDGWHSRPGMVCELQAKVRASGPLGYVRMLIKRVATGEADQALQRFNTSFNQLAPLISQGQSVSPAVGGKTSHCGSNLAQRKSVSKDHSRNPGLSAMQQAYRATLQQPTSAKQHVATCSVAASGSAAALQSSRPAGRAKCSKAGVGAFTVRTL